jgi:hypothetical protein
MRVRSGTDRPDVPLTARPVTISLPMIPPTRADVPPCRRMGRQCHALDVTLRIGSLEEGQESLDHEATWLMGHTERIAFGVLWRHDGELYLEATLHVPCRFYRETGPGSAACAAHAFMGQAPRRPIRTGQPRQLGGDRFVVVERMHLARRTLGFPRRALRVLAGPVTANPCEGAPCQTSDHRRGAACCRDMQVEIMCTRKQVRLERLVRSRKSPYLCKVGREGDFSIEAELISACGYLEPGGVACTLHGRTRADGRSAKPDLCFDWPPKNKGLHPGCVFQPGRRAKRASSKPAKGLRP